MGTNSNIFRGISIAVSILAMICNAIGVYVLSKIDFRKTNQVIIIKSLSITEIIISIGWVIGDVLHFYGFKSGATSWNINWSIKAGIYLTWYSMIYMLTVDRLLGCNFPLQHRIWVRIRNIKIAVATMWIVGVLIGISMSLFEAKQLYIAFNKYVWPILDGIFLVLFTTTYATIYCRVSKRAVHQSTQSDQTKFVRMITAILLTFVVCEIIPVTINLIFFMATKIGTPTMRSIIVLSYNIHTLIDPLVYIFLQRKARHLLIHKLGRCSIRRKIYTFENARSYDVSNAETRAIGDSKLKSSTYIQNWKNPAPVLQLTSKISNTDASDISHL